MTDVRQSNPKFFDEIDFKLKELEGYEGKVGFFENQKYPDGTQIAYVAAIQELGSGKIPPRPTFRPAQIKNEQKWKDTAAIAANKVIEGDYNGQQAMELICQVARGDVFEEYADLTAPPLSPITLGIRQLKKDNPELKVTGATVGRVAAQLKAGTLDYSGISTKPLNDTGTLIDALKYTVESTK